MKEKLERVKYIFVPQILVKLELVFSKKNLSIYLFIFKIT